MDWRFDLTPELVPCHRQQLVWAMQRQDARLQAQLRSVRNVPPWVLIVVGVIGLVTLALVVTSGPTHVSDWIWTTLAALLFVIAIERGVRRTVRPDPRKRVWQMTNRTIANVADRTFRKVTGRYRVDYELIGTRLRSRVASSGIDHVVDLAKIKIAIATPNSVVLFRRRLSQVPKRIVYVDGPEREGVLAALTHAAIERVDGPLEGYAADTEIPRAIVRA